MPQINVGSANIATFGYSLNVDILDRSMTFSLLPFTTGSGLSNCKVAFFVKDQGGITLASINWASPQIPDPGTTTSWVLDLSSFNFPFLFQTYQIIAAIQDPTGIVYQTDPIFPNICQPNDLTDQGYVPGMFEIIPDCINSVLAVKELTPLVYNSLQPSSVSKNGTIYYPTGTNISVSFQETPFTNNVVYTGQYSITNTTIATYAIGNDVYVLVSYVVTGTVFPVTCNNRMANVMCCITKVQQEAIRNCNNAIGANAKKQLEHISMFVMTGIMKEISGQDARSEVEYIKEYLSCDCGNGSLRQSEFTPINPSVNSIVLKGQGGTTIPAPTQTGNTLTYNIASNVYQVVQGDTGDLAFSITMDTSVPNTVKYVITFNYDTMAGYILTAISNDPTLIAQLNSLITSASGIQGLDGNCIIDLTRSNYSLSQNITNATIINSVVINGNIYNAPANLFAINPTAVASWLNSLTLGTFSASVSGNILTILSLNNTNVIATMTFGSPNVTQQFSATNGTLVQVLQAIINYLCSLTDLSVQLKNALTLCTLDYNNNVVTTTVPSGTAQSLFNLYLSQSICNICGRINTLVKLTCTQLQGLFSDSINAVFNLSTDRFLSVVGGSCITLTGQQMALAVIAAINAYSNVKAAFCAINCSAPATCPDIASINMSVVSGNIAIYGVGFTQTPTANQIVTVNYRLNGSLVWTTATNALNIAPNGNVASNPPFLISSGLSAGMTYQVQIINNCGGNGFIGQITIPTGSVYSGNFRLDNFTYLICGDPTTILYSNAPFATGVTMYTDPGLSMRVTGYNYIANSLGQIYAINPTTGVVGANIGSSCANGTAGTYILGNDAGTICSEYSQTLYTNGPFTIGGTLYADAALTMEVIGYLFVVQVASQIIYNLNNTNGQIVSTTGATCNPTLVRVINSSSFASMQITNVTGIIGFTPSPSFPIGQGQESDGSHTAFTGVVSVTLSGTPSLSLNLSLIVNGVLIQCINVPSAGVYSFNNRSYASTDQIQIVGASGSC